MSPSPGPKHRPASICHSRRPRVVWTRTANCCSKSPPSVGGNQCASADSQPPSPVPSLSLSPALALAGPGRPAVSQEQPLTVPPGFHVSVFAQNLNGVRYLVVGPGGVVYASRPSAGDILRLADANHDGVADSAVTAVSGLNGPFGIAFRGDTMYGAENMAVCDCARWS